MVYSNRNNLIDSSSSVDTGEAETRENYERISAKATSRQNRGYFDIDIDRPEYTEYMQRFSRYTIETQGEFNTIIEEV